MYAWHDTPWMWLTMTLFWVLLAVAVYFVLSGPRGPTLSRRGPRAIEILEERYARGELSAEEYRERRETLDAASSPGHDEADRTPSAPRPGRPQDEG